jgi:hypothetical protein
MKAKLGLTFHRCSILTPPIFRIAPTHMNNYTLNDYVQTTTSDISM